jgi:hypothetical protein
MMSLQQQPQFDWASESQIYSGLHHTENAKQQDDKWAFSGAGSMQTQAPFSIPPSLLTHATVERYGQVTPPEELSPADLKRDDRETSIPVEQLRNEIWPPRHQENAQLDESRKEPSPKRRRTSQQTSANQDHPNNTLPSAPVPQHHQQQQDIGDHNPQPPKRKRGRPKSQPQMVEAYTADGYPFQVSSARQTHLEKNRVAAHKCRQRKKEYINSLEGRAREHSARNKILKENVAMLREEVLSLKNEVLRHAGCGFWAVDEYLARCAGDLLGMEAPGMRNSVSQHNSTHQSPAMSTMSNPHLTNQQARETSMGSMSSADADEFGGLELLKDFTDEDMDELEEMRA